MKRSQYRRSHGDAPKVVPNVIATVNENGRLAVEVDGASYTRSPIGRDAFGALLDDVMAQHGSPVHVEVREYDGRTYTDLLSASASGARRTPQTSPVLNSVGPMDLEIAGDGFVPGEEVAFAPIARRTTAGPEGNALVRCDVESIEGADEVVLFGRISGTIVVRRVDS